VGIVLSAEHASRALPVGVELGLPAAELEGHRAWDPGTAELARALGGALGLRPHLGRWSRLVVDLNRRDADPDAVPGVSFGLAVPGNLRLSAAQRASRLERWHRPWRAAVVEDIDAAVATHGACLHLSLHSFTPALAPAARAFDLGLLYDPGRPAELAWVAALEAELAGRGLVLRHNAPYPGTAEGLCTFLRERWSDARYAGIEVELNQDRWHRTAGVAVQGILAALAPCTPEVGPVAVVPG
jgi:predicted N-formylglutamate amidohydrolase